MVSLTKNDFYLLEHIYRFGGYCRINFLEYLYPQLSYRALHKKLTVLVNKGYLVNRKFLTSSKSEASTYQINSKSCKLFNDGNSYSRKPHTFELAFRYLLRSEFLFSLSDNYHTIIDRNKDRIQKLNNENFIQKFYPYKKNKDSTFLHIEEFIIDCSTLISDIVIDDSQIICNSNRLLFVYSDKYNVSITKQLMTLFLKYRNVIEHYGMKKLDFLILVNDDLRKENYLNCFKIIDTSLNAEPLINRLLADCCQILKGVKNEMEIKKDAIHFEYPDQETVSKIKDKFTRNGLNFLSDFVLTVSDSNRIYRLYLLIISLLLNNDIDIQDNHFYVRTSSNMIFKNVK